MPETSMNARVETVVQHCQRVRSLLKLNPQRLTTIQVHLGLTKPRTLSVLQRLEEQGEIFATSVYGGSPKSKANAPVSEFLTSRSLGH